VVANRVIPSDRVRTAENARIQHRPGI